MKNACLFIALICILGLIPDKLLAMEEKNQEQGAPGQEKKKGNQNAGALSSADLGRKLLEALESEDKKEAIRIIQAHDLSATLTNKHMQSIHIAIERGWTDILSMLFFLAARAGHYEALKLLLASGVDATASSPLGPKWNPFKVFAHVIIGSMARGTKSQDYADQAAHIRKLLKLLFKNGASIDESTWLYSLIAIVTTAGQIRLSYTDEESISVIYHFLSSFLEVMQLFGSMTVDFLVMLRCFLNSQVTEFELAGLNHEEFILLACLLSYGFLDGPKSIAEIPKFGISIENPSDERRLEDIDITFSWSSDLATILTLGMKMPHFTWFFPWFLDEMHCTLLFDLSAACGTVEMMEEIFKKSICPVTQEMFASAFVSAAARKLRLQNIRWLAERALVEEHNSLWTDAVNRALDLAVMRGDSPMVNFILQFALEHGIELDVTELIQILSAIEKHRPNERYRTIRRALRFFSNRRWISRIILDGQPEAQEGNEESQVITTALGAIPNPTHFTQLPMEIRAAIHELSDLGKL